MAGRTWARIAASVAISVGITVLFAVILPGVNATTVGFAYLLVVLGLASTWGFAPALMAALAATAEYNFFFLPPVGNFTIEDARNWVALAAFLATAAIVSRLSAQAQSRAREAEMRRQDAARLYELSRAILLASPEEETSALERALVRIFELREATIQPAGAGTPAGSSTLHTRLRVGQHEVGTLSLEGPALAAEVSEAIASMCAIALEKSRLRQEAARLTALREADTLKSALLDAFTHDLRTPLTSIKASATALLEESPPLQRELAAVIVEEADRLNGLLANLLDMARLEAGAVRATAQPVAAEAVIQAVLARLGSDAALRYEAAADLPLLLGDGPLTARALEQMVRNALAYGGREATVCIIARATQGRIRIEVRDRGPGVDAKLGAHVFEKFTRAPMAGAARPEGLGTGLAIARGLIEAQEGRVGYEPNPGGGACFWLELPQAEAGATMTTGEAI